MKTKEELKEGDYLYKLGYEHCKDDVLELIKEIHTTNKIGLAILKELKARIEGK